MNKRSEFTHLRAAVLKLDKMRPMRLSRKLEPLWQREQPFDDLLLERSALYRESRKQYLANGGRFEAVFCSSPRMLSSPTLLENKIQYTPIQSEMIWAMRDKIQSKSVDHVLNLRTYVGSLFHEQNHRILWSLLPPAPQDPAGIRKYLNFAESLVISADMALGDELGLPLSGPLYLSGTIYDPGTEMKSPRKNRAKLSKRQYRNYLQATTYATYLNLEFYDPKDVEKATQALFPVLGPLAARAASRSSRLDRAFVWKTNPIWQKKHRKWILSELSGRRPLILPDQPLDNREQYLLTEKWFEALGL